MLLLNLLFPIDYLFPTENVILLYQCSITTRDILWHIINKEAAVLLRGPLSAEVLRRSGRKHQQQRREKKCQAIWVHYRPACKKSVLTGPEEWSSADFASMDNGFSLQALPEHHITLRSHRLLLTVSPPLCLVFFSDQASKSHWVHSISVLNCPEVISGIRFRACTVHIKGMNCAFQQKEMDPKGSNVIALCWQMLQPFLRYWL